MLRYWSRYIREFRSHPTVLFLLKALEYRGIERMVTTLASAYHIIASAALLMLTSKFEGFGYVIVEAQALSVPVISTDCPFEPKELLPAQNLVPVGNIEALVSLVQNAIAYPNDYKVAFNPKLRPPIIAAQYLALRQKRSND